MKLFDELEQIAAKKLVDILSFLDVAELAGPAGHPNCGCDFTLAFGDTLLVCEVKAQLWPNQLPSVAHSLWEYCRKNTNLCVPVVISPSISQRSSELCRELGINWADFAGNCHIQFGNILIHVEGKKGEQRAIRGTSSLYTPRASRIVHALLLAPQRWWKVTDLVQQTQVSLGQVSNVRKLLVRHAFAEAGAAGIRLTEPRRLLLDWASNYPPKRVARRYYFLKKPSDLVRAVETNLSSYALTEMAAADRYAPYTRYQSVAFYVSEWQFGFEKALDLRPAENTANVTIYEDANGLLFSERSGEVSLASPILTYLDLTKLGGRGQDAADHLLESSIVTRWS
ncbi:MAG TPA: type IV toxin-antitoxin system AbiEi family antitoxin [Fimbriimonadaceae bacterium]|jgi:hypothetical protein